MLLMEMSTANKCHIKLLLRKPWSFVEKLTKPRYTL